jgi:hypothetical protein
MLAVCGGWRCTTAIYVRAVLPCRLAVRAIASGVGTLHTASVKGSRTVFAFTASSLAVRQPVQVGFGHTTHRSPSQGGFRNAAQLCVQADRRGSVSYKPTAAGRRRLNAALVITWSCTCVLLFLHFR